MVRRSIGQRNNMLAEMSKVQETVSHLQEFCTTLLQAVTPPVSGNQIVLPTNTQSTTTSVTADAHIPPLTGVCQYSGSSADSIHYRKHQLSFMAKL